MKTWKEAGKEFVKDFTEEELLEYRNHSMQRTL